MAMSNCKCFDRFFRPNVTAKVASSIIDLTLLTLFTNFARRISGPHIRLLKNLLTISGTCTSPFKMSFMVKFSGNGVFCAVFLISEHMQLL